MDILMLIRGHKIRICIMLNNLEIFSKVAKQNNMTLTIDKSGKCDCVIIEGLDFLKLEDECIFINCDDQESKSLLTAWLSGEFMGNYDVDLSDFLPEQIIPVFKKRIIDRHLGGER
jgi:hypothetical protein